jgi:hypothetical protein
VAQQALALHDHRAGPEPDRLTTIGRAAAEDRKLAAVERRVRPQAQAQRPVPVQLTAAVLGQALPPLRLAVVPEGALHDATAPADDHPADHQRRSQRYQHGGNGQASCKC